MQYPEDSESTRTEYTYDSMYRQAKAVCETSSNLSLSAEYTYEGDYLTTIETPTTTYNFEYGYFGLRKSVKVGSQELAGYTYTKDWYLDKLTYGNDDYVSYTYDEKKGRLLTQTYEDGDKVSYTYNNDGDLATVTDHATGITTTYYYDLLGRQTKYVEKGNGFTHSVGYECDKDNNLAELVENINGTERTTSYEYDDDNRVTSVTTDGITVIYSYDDFGRVTEQVTKNGNTTILTESFTYTGDTDAKTTSSQIKTYTTTAGSPDADGYSVTYTYTYDDNGNITSIYDGTNTVAYQYDSANQLIQEHHVESEYGYMFGYDEAGNITYKHHCLANESTNQLEVVGETFYSYDNSSWGDLLTGHFEGEIVYTYDPIGNPLSLAGRTYTWEHGRQLATLTQYGTTWEYQYNTDGLRTQRSDGNATYQYVYNGSQLTQMTVDTDGDDEVDITLAFTYDASGIPLTVTYGSTKYYYATNLQGDVVAILNADGTTAASYTYDAWGNCLNSYTSGIGFLNPLRYRGYVYDQETELYYLQSRYYDPEVGRFVNADALVATGQGLLGNNMFAYCHSNPVLYVDPSGYVIVIADGATEKQIAEYERAIAYLKTSETGKKLIETLETSETVFYIVLNDGNKMEFDPKNHIIYFDTNCGLLLLDGSSAMSPALGLAHEMGHAAQYLDGTMRDPRNDEDIIEALNLETYEIPIANDLKEPVRNHYRAERGTIDMNNSIHFQTTKISARPWWHYLAFWKLFQSNRVVTDHNQ